MKILHVIGSLAPREGGPPKACVEMARAVAARGHHVEIMTTDKDGAGRLDVPFDRPVRDDGVTIRYFPVGFPRAWRTSRPLARALAAAIPDYDVVHVHSLYLHYDWVVGRVCRQVGVPYVVRPHGTLDPYIRRRHRLRKRVVETLFQDRMLAAAAAVHFTSAEEARLAAAHAGGARAVVIANGVDLAVYDSLPPRGRFRAHHPEIGARRIVLFLGRLNFKKGLDVLLPAFAALAGARDDVHLVIAGPDGGEAAAVAADIAAIGLGGRVTLPGMVLGDDKRALLGDADVFVLPSRSENFGIAVVEAMASGVPVAISEQVNIWREIVDGGAGLAGPVAAAAVTAMMARILDDPGASARMGAAGRALVAARFQWSAIAPRLEALYAEVADSARQFRD